MDLYLMQNCYGLIKIGRSKDPENRRIRLRQELRCEIVIIKTLPGDGHREEEFFSRMRRFNVAGEWYRGTDLSRAAASKLFRLPAGYSWPYRLDRRAAQDWLYGIYADVQEARYVKGARHRLIIMLKKALADPDLTDEDCADLDGVIAMILDGEETLHGYTVLQDENGRHYAAEPDIIGFERIPHYTTDLKVAASLLDPMGLIPLPVKHNGSPKQVIAFCIEALSRRWSMGRGRATKTVL